MGKTYSNSKGGDRKVAKSMDELEALIDETQQPPQRFQKRKVNMSINATTVSHRNALVPPGKSNVLSAASAAAVATPVRIEPIVSVHVDGVLQHPSPPHLPGSGVVVEVKAHLNNAMHELEEMSAALKPVTAIVAVPNLSREIPPAPLLPTVNKTKDITMNNEPTFTEAEIQAIHEKRAMVAKQLATANEASLNAAALKQSIDVEVIQMRSEAAKVMGSMHIPVPSSVIEKLESKRMRNKEIISKAIQSMPELSEPIADLEASQYVPSTWPYSSMSSADRQSGKDSGGKSSSGDGFFSGIASKYDDMSTTAKVVTGVVVVAAVAGAGYYAYKHFTAPVGDVGGLVNNDDLV